MKDAKVDEKQLVYVEAILSSMTKYKSAHPKVIDGNRRRRISMGSGTSIQQVNQVLKQFDQMRKMIKKLTGSSGNMRKMKQMMGKFQ